MPNDINLTQRTHDLGDVITSVRNAHGYWILVVAKLARELKYAGTLLADAKRNPHDVCKLNVINCMVGATVMHKSAVFPSRLL